MLQSVPWFADFLVAWADDWGRFLDSPEPLDDTSLHTFIDESPRFRIQDSMIGDPPRSNNSSGRLTFNQFFARVPVHRGRRGARTCWLHHAAVTRTV